MRRVDREVLEALWSQSRDLCEYAAEVRAEVVVSQRRSEELRERIAFGRTRFARVDDGALLKRSA